MRRSSVTKSRCDSEQSDSEQVFDYEKKELLQLKNHAEPEDWEKVTHHWSPVEILDDPDAEPEDWENVHDEPVEIPGDTDAEPEDRENVQDEPVEILDDTDEEPEDWQSPAVPSSFAGTDDDLLQKLTEYETTAAEFGPEVQLQWMEATTDFANCMGQGHVHLLLEDTVLDDTELFARVLYTVCPAGQRRLAELRRWQIQDDGGVVRTGARSFS